jgi:hypothetical protein
VTDPDEITQAWREHLAEEAAKCPITYFEASASGRTIVDARPGTRS